MQTSPHYIAQRLKSKLPADQSEAGWGFLTDQFPWFPFLHLLQAANHPNNEAVLGKASLYQDNILRLHCWLREDDMETAVSLSMDIKDSEPVFIAETPPVYIPQHFIPVELNREDEAEETAENDEETEGPEIKIPDLSKMLESPASKASSFTFEPFHTVDYFASQGIKVDKEADKQVTTQLDRQVKSFTDWLKTMKKLSYQPVVAYTDPLVEAQARSSLNKREIVTEAMAEVWIKQGHFDMAAEVFAKLMLQHPEKTPYFAARLQDLKEKK